MSTMDRCPYAKPKEYGAHHLNFVVPEDSAHPLTLVCERCGDVKQVSLDVVGPLDDLTAEDIRSLSRRG